MFDVEASASEPTLLPPTTHGGRGRRGTGGAARRLTLAQTRALRAMAASAEVSLRGISWTTARALRALGLCELGPGRRGRLTGKGRAALLAEDAKAALP